MSHRLLHLGNPLSTKDRAWCTGQRAYLTLLQKHISLTLGLAQAHISRILKELHEEQVIHKTRHTIEILDFGYFRQIACFDDDHYLDDISSLTKHLH